MRRLGAFNNYGHGKAFKALGGAFPAFAPGFIYYLSACLSMRPIKKPERRVPDRRRGGRTYTNFKLADQLASAGTAPAIGGRQPPQVVAHGGDIERVHPRVFETVGRRVAGAEEVGWIQVGTRRKRRFSVDRRIGVEDRRSGRDRRQGSHVYTDFVLYDETRRRSQATGSAAEIFIPPDRGHPHLKHPQVFESDRELSGPDVKPVGRITIGDKTSYFYVARRGKGRRATDV